MELLISAFVIIGIVMVGMAVGVIFRDRPLKGTCGGLGNMRDELGMPMCECGAAPGDSCASEEAAKDAVFTPDAVPAAVAAAQ